MSLEWLLDLPDDVWQEIFDQLDEPADILACMLTCTRFKNLAIKSLYRSFHHIEHYQPGSPYQSSIVEIPSNLSQLVRTVVLSTGLGEDHMGTVDDWGLELRIRDLHRSNAWLPYDDPATLSSLFPSSYSQNITKLVWNGFELPQEFHRVLRTLKNLRSLHFISAFDIKCDASVSTAVASLSNLVDLRIWRHYWGEYPILYRYSEAIDNILFSSQYLDTLHLDWSDWSSGVIDAFITEEKKPKHHERFLLITLSNLRELCIRILSKDAALPRSLGGSSPERLYAQMGDFLRYCKSLEEFHLVVEGGYGIPTSAAQAVGYVGLAKLKALSGASLLLLPLLLPQSAEFLESLSIPHQGNESTKLWRPNPRQRPGTVCTYSTCTSPGTLEDPSPELISSTFSRIHVPNLKELTIFCEEWHREVLICVTKCFPCLKSLKIGYRHGVVSESEWISMGPLQLHNLPNLKVFYLYQHKDTRPCDPPLRLLPEPPSSPDPEFVHDVFLAWDRYVQLDEVSFSHDSVWTRGRVVECATGNNTPDGIPRSEWAWSEWTEFKASD